MKNTRWGKGVCAAGGGGGGDDVGEGRGAANDDAQTRV